MQTFRNSSQPHPGEPIVEITALTDLSEWVPAADLNAWIELEIAGLNGDVPQVVGPPPPDSPKMLIALLSFAYATRIFSCEEVAARCCSDTTFRQICRGSFPAAQELSSFRRQNRPLLQRILARVLLRAVRHRFDLDADRLSPELEQDLWNHAARRLDVARHLDTDE